MGREEGTVGKGTVEDMSSTLMEITRRGDHLGAQVLSLVLSEKDVRTPG